MNDYRSIFSKRALQYAFASQKYPLIRVQEFLSIINKANIKKQQYVLDLACGNAIISNFLQSVNYFGIDPCESFLKTSQKGTLIAASLRSLPFIDGYFDHVICLTGLHHETSRKEIYKECFRVLIPKGGKFTIHDVQIDSDISIFLDSFVNNYNPQGHAGNYLGSQDILELESIGFSTNFSIVKYVWKAKRIDEMYEFMINLFGLENLSIDRFINEIERYLMCSLDENGFTVQWNLFSIEAIKK